MDRHAARNSRLALCLATAALLGACRSIPAEEHAAKGDGYVAAKRYPEAIVEYRTALRKNSDLGEVYLKLGHALLQTKDVQSAAAHYVRAAQLLPNHLEAQLRAGDVLLVAKQYGGAASVARRALQIDRTSIRAHVLNANALAGLKRHESALEAIERVIALDPARAASYEELGALQLAAAPEGKSTPEQAQASFERAVELNPRSADLRLTLASFYWAQGKTVQAEAELRQALAVDAESVPVHRALAAFLIGMGRAPEAELHLKKAVAGLDTTPAWLMLADYYLSQRRARDAAAVLHRIAGRPDGFGEARSRQARLAYDAGRKDEAHKLIDDTLERDPVSVRALLTRAQFLLLDNNRDAAIEPIRAALRVDPRSLPAKYMLASIYVQRREFDAARREYADIIDINPSSVAAELELARLDLVRQTPGPAGESAQRAATARPDSIAAQTLLLRSLISKNDIGRAAALSRQLTASAGDRAEVHWLAGMVALQSRNHGAARTSFERALALRPDALEPLDGLVALDIADRQPARAQARIEAALRDRPRSLGLLMLAGRAYQSTGDPARAEQALRTAIEVDPNEPAIYDTLARLFAAQKRLDAAVTEFEALARRNPDAVGPPTMLGTILQAKNRLFEAQAWYEKALKIDPRAAVAANNLAWLYAEQGGDLEAAQKLALVALEQLPGRPEVNNTVGWVYYNRDEVSLAIPALERSVEQDPRNPYYHYHLGLAYAKAGSAPQARKALEAALRLNPQFQGAANARAVLGTL